MEKSTNYEIVFTVMILKRIETFKQFPICCCNQNITVLYSVKKSHLFHSKE
jgi:hypothetical protein